MNFFSLLTIAFIVLKLTDAISWSWWWVLSPLLAMVAGAVVMAALKVCLDERQKKERRRVFEKKGY